MTHPYPVLILRQGIIASNGTATMPGFHILHWQFEYPVDRIRRYNRKIKENASRGGLGSET